MNKVPRQHSLLAQSVESVSGFSEDDLSETQDAPPVAVQDGSLQSLEATDPVMPPAHGGAVAHPSGATVEDGEHSSPPLFSRQAAVLLADPIAEVSAETVVQADELPVEDYREQPFLDEITVPPGNGEVIRAIEVRYIDRAGQPVDGITHDYIVTRQFDLNVGDVYDPEKAKAGLRRVIETDAIQNARLTLEPTDNPNDVIMAIDVLEASRFAFIGGTQFVRPWVLQGVTLPRPTSTSPPRLTGFQLPGSVQWQNVGGNDQNLTFGFLVGDEAGGTALTFVDPWIGESSTQIGYAINVHGLSYQSPNFNGGDDEVELPNGDEDFWEQRIGGGVQIMQQPTPEFGWAAGISYDVISVRSSFLGDQVYSEDEFGNPLTLSDDGIDTLLAAHFALVLDQRNDKLFPTSGSRFQFAIDQSIPVGDANIVFTRPMANFTQFVPLSLIRLRDTPSTLIFNLQGGSLLGDVPPYEAFALGGSGSVRGYGAGDVASAQTFLQTSLEYRFPFALIRWKDGFFQDLLGEETLFAGNVFFDYATGFGTQTFVTGEPGVARGKPGDGFGYGIGLLATSNFGLARLEFGIGDNGDTAVYFAIGDRF